MIIIIISPLEAHSDQIYHYNQHKPLIQLTSVWLLTNSVWINAEESISL